MFGDSSLYHQGIAVELLRGPAPAGSHLDVGCARHDGQALHPLSDPLRRLRLTAGLRHRHGALHPAAGGEIQNRREKKGALCLRLQPSRRQYFMKGSRVKYSSPTPETSTFSSF